MAKNEKKWKQVGNYLLGIEKNSTGDYLVCKTFSGNWSVRWRNDTMMYGLMLSIIRNEDAEQYLHALLTLMYTATTYPHDLVAIINKSEMPVIEGFTELIVKQNEYEAKQYKQPTDEEDADTISEMKQMAEVEAEINRIAKEEEEKKDA